MTEYDEIRRSVRAEIKRIRAEVDAEIAALPIPERWWMRMRIGLIRGYDAVWYWWHGRTAP